MHIRLEAVAYRRRSAEEEEEEEEEERQQAKKKGMFCHAIRPIGAGGATPLFRCGLRAVTGD